MEEEGGRRRMKCLVEDWVKAEQRYGKLKNWIYCRKDEVCEGCSHTICTPSWVGYDSQVKSGWCGGNEKSQAETAGNLPIVSCIMLREKQFAYPSNFAQCWGSKPPSSATGAALVSEQHWPSRPSLPKCLDGLETADCGGVGTWWVWGCHGNRGGTEVCVSWFWDRVEN